MTNLKTIFSSIALLLCIGLNAANKEAKITIDSRVKYQHVTGFGGFSPSPQWSYWLGDTEMDKLFGKGESQLGLNILRIYISNNKNFWNSGVANTKRAKKYGAFVFASPWSPPASWKSNGEVANGGSLKEENYADWAKFLNDYYLYMKGQGAKIDAVSIQNEPDWNASYESCIWTGAQMAKFLKEQGSKIQCKIIAPEAIHFTPSMHEPILNDPEACAELDILGGHFYGWNGSSYPLAAQKGKEVWMTEFLINERQQNSKINIDWKTDGFLFARSVNDAMLANMSAWVHYSLKRYYGCLGDGEYGTKNNTITKRGYILSHYAKYVSGTTRIRHALEDTSNKLTSSAYLSVTGDSIVVMLLNTGEETYNTTLDLPFNTLGGRQIVTTETQNMKKAALAWEEETHTPVLEVAPYSVNTYIFIKNSDREDMPTDEEAEMAKVFQDDFNLYGGGVIPTGWKSKYESGTRSAGSYDSGPRIMSFSPEGLVPYAFYFRAGTSGVGYVSYGEDTKNRLVLTPGSYTLSYSLIGWKAKPTVTMKVTTTGSKTIKSASGAPKVMISANGTSSRITAVTEKELAFDIADEGNYILKWQVPQASSGLNEMLVCDINLVKHEENGEDVIIPLNLPQSGKTFDLNGRQITAPQKGIYIQNGKKYLKY